MARLLPVLSVLLWDIQQRKLRLSPFEQHGVPFPLVVAESDILPIDVPVARLQLSDQRAFGNLSATQKSIWTDMAKVCDPNRRMGSVFLSASLQSSGSIKKHVP